MPKGPNGDHRATAARERTVKAANVASGKLQDKKTAKRGSEGGEARAAAMSAQERSKIVTRAADARWKQGRRAMNTAAPGTLAERYRTNQTDGVVDVKFLLKSEGEYSDEEAIAEHRRWDQALIDGRYRILELDHSRWKD